MLHNKGQTTGDVQKQEGQIRLYQKISEKAFTDLELDALVR